MMRVNCAWICKVSGTLSSISVNCIRKTKRTVFSKSTMDYGHCPSKSIISQLVLNSYASFECIKIELKTIEECDQSEQVHLKVQWLNLVFSSKEEKIG